MLILLIIDVKYVINVMPHKQLISILCQIGMTILELHITVSYSQVKMKTFVMIYKIKSNESL